MFEHRLDQSPRGPLHRLRRLDWSTVLLLCLIAAVGVACLYSVADGSFLPWAERHAVRFMLALALLLAIAMTPIEVWRSLAYPGYAIAIALLALVPFIGVEAMGATRWLSVAGTSVQPSELMKVALVAALARFYQDLPATRVSHPLSVAIALLIIAAPTVLTLRQPDLGTSIMFVVVGLGLMFIAGVSLLYFAAGALLAAALAPLAWTQLHDYQRRRIEVFLDPDRDPLGAGYHITQSKIALGSGGLNGRGYMQGSQARLDFLPEKHTDFIFTMLAEEWGFVGSLAVLMLYLVLVVLLMAKAFSCRSAMARLLAAGAAMTAFVYAFFNMAMVCGLLPVVGVPLPLISFGGTAMFTMMAMVGLALAAGIDRRHALPSPH